MSTDLFDQYATLDPAGTPEALPDWTSTAPVLLAEIDERTHPMQTKHHSAKANDSERRWTGVLIAAAAFAVVMILGVSLSLLNRGGDSPDVIEPVITTTPTSVPEATPTTIPDATMTSVPDATPSVVVTVPSESAAPAPIDEISGVAVADGSLWAATGEGIVQWDLEERQAVLFTSDDGLPFDDGSSGKVAIAPDGTVWAFTWSKDLARFDGARWAEPAGYDQLDIVNPRCASDEECLDPVTAVAVGPNGLLSLAVGEETLLQSDGVDWSVLPVTRDETHAGSAWATDMTVAQDGTLWVASWEELLAYNGDTWDRFTASDGLPPGMINTVAVAPNGEVWVGTASHAFEGDSAGGVARFDGDSWTVFDETDGLYGNAVTALAVGQDGTVWAVHGSTGNAGAARELAVGGVSRFDGTAWTSATISDVGVGFGFGGAAVDDAGTLWIGSRWGVVGFDGVETTVLQVPEGMRPVVEAPHWVIEGGEDILATTVAKASPPVATCPAGSEPNLPGPVDQPRPPPSYFMKTAMDRQSGRIVAIDATGGTWTFDVCANMWMLMNGSDFPLRETDILVYDVDSDVTVAIGARVYVYDVDTDTWERYGPPPMNIDDFGDLRAVYDPVSGMIVVRSIASSEMWAYDVETDTWTPIRQGPISPPRVDQSVDSRGYHFFAQLHAYDASTDRIVLYLADNASGPGVWDGAGTEMTWTYNLRAGEWTIEETVTPELAVGAFFSPTGKAVYDEAAQLTVITADGVVAGYETTRREWQILWESSSEMGVYGTGTGPHHRAGDTLVYDPTNDRIIVIGGDARMLDEDPLWVSMNDVWAFEAGTGTWSELLAPLDQ